MAVVCAPSIDKLVLIGAPNLGFAALVLLFVTFVLPLANTPCFNDVVAVIPFPCFDTILLGTVCPCPVVTGC